MRMTKFLYPLLLILLAAASTVRAQSVQLRDGTILMGRVETADTEGLSFLRLDTGGLLQLQWNDLTLHSAEGIKRLRGLLVETEEEPTVMADVIEYATAGGGRDEVVGVLQGQTDTHMELKLRSGVIPVLRRNIKKISRREVPVGSVYTDAEYYQKMLGEVAPGSDADKHVALADLLRRAGLLDRSLSHLQQAEQLGGGGHRAKLPQMIARVETLIESGAERDLLAEIRVLTNRGDFDRAAAKIDEFESSYPDTRLAGDLARVKNIWQNRRERYLIGEVYRRFPTTLWSLVRGQAADPQQVPISAARAYAEGPMANELWAEIAKDLEIEEQEVRNLWSLRQRDRRRVGWNFGYGVGSWVLGKEDILEGAKLREDGRNTRTAEAESDPELDRILRKMAEVQRRARQVQRRQRGGSRETEEDWWRRAERREREEWLRAYFAEHSGVLERVRVHLESCPTCAGNGSITVLSGRGSNAERECPVCHGTRFIRSHRSR